jgi:hypothetical protein
MIPRAKACRQHFVSHEGIGDRLTTRQAASPSEPTDV